MDNMTFPESPFPEANAQLEWIDAKYDALQSMAANAQSIQSEIDALVVSVWSAGREVRVAVASTGLLSEVEYTVRSEQLGEQALARLTLSTVKAAMVSLTEKIAEAAETSGDPAVASAICAEYVSALATSAGHLGGGDIELSPR